MEAVAQICDSHLTADFPFHNISGNASALIQSLLNLTPVFNETFLICKWRNTVEGCENYYRKVITEDGICYSFNALDIQELYRDEA